MTGVDSMNDIFALEMKNDIKQFQDVALACQNNFVNHAVCPFKALYQALLYVRLQPLKFGRQV